MPDKLPPYRIPPMPTTFPEIMAAYTKSKEDAKAYLAEGDRESEAGAAEAWTRKLEDEIFHWSCPSHNPEGDFTKFTRNL